jgi:hypothetical protein
MEVTRLESRPPDSSTPYGTSAMRRFTTLSTSVVRMSSRSAGFVGMTSTSIIQLGAYQRTKPLTVPGPPW